MNHLLSDEDQAACAALLDAIQKHDRMVVAFSGGVDSAVVAAAARRALGPRAVAAIGISPSVPERQIEWAQRVADEIGIPMKAIPTDELALPQYQRNDSMRCFYCKQTLYGALAAIAANFSGAVIASGTNADDLNDYRPGIDAAGQAGVVSPLADLGIGKSQVRRLARHWNLSVWNLPAGPCLASRIAYGEPVTVEKLRAIDAAENWLRDRGFDRLRVRLHPGMLARIEVPPERIGELLNQAIRDELNVRFRQLGFQFITLDVEGFRSGNLNQLVTL